MGYKSDRLGGSDPYSASKGSAELAFISYFKSFSQMFQYQILELLQLELEM